jgi:23S rRNA (uridine2552-2'-O)-methyltransferase
LSGAAGQSFPKPEFVAKPGIVKRKNPYLADVRTRNARLAGYPARSVFKLEEIDQRCRLLHSSIRVLDLGAAPGSWSLYAAQRIGSQGLVVAVDVRPIAQSFPEHVVTFQEDALTSDGTSWSKFAPFDLVLSDMAPNTSGSRVRDQALSFELFERALGVAVKVGKPGSDFVAKLFMSDAITQAKMAVTGAYEQMRIVRPEGTRQNSSEVFLVGKSKRR